MEINGAQVKTGISVETLGSGGATEAPGLVDDCVTLTMLNMLLKFKYTVWYNKGKLIVYNYVKLSNRLKTREVYMDNHNRSSCHFKKANLGKILLFGVILIVFTIWAINLNISEEIQSSYKYDSDSFSQEYNSYIKSIETFMKDPNIKTFGDTQKHFGLLVKSIDQWDLSISRAIEKNIIKDIDRDFLYESWPDIRKFNNVFIDSVIIQNNSLHVDQLKIAEAIEGLSSVYDSIMGTYYLE